MAENLVEGLLREIMRNVELKQEYIAIGPAGKFGAIMIQQNIDEANRAIATGDVVAELKIYEMLKSNK